MKRFERTSPLTTSLRTGLAAGLIAVAGLASWSSAQDSKPSSPPPAKAGEGEKNSDKPGERRGGRNREQLRDDLMKRLDEAKARIAKGEEPRDVMRDLFPLAAGRQGQGGPGPGGRGPRDGDEMDGPPGGPEGGPDDGPLGGPRQGRGMGPGGRFAGPNGPGGDMGKRGPMTPEQIDRAMDFIKENMPQLHERLATFRETDSVGFERLMNRMGPKIHEAASIKERDPALYDLRASEIRSGIQVLESARAYHEIKRGKDSSPEKLEAAKKTLRDALQAQYESRLAAQAHEIKALSKRVEKLQGDLDKSKTDREKAVDGLLDAITKGKEPRDVPFPPPRPRDGRPGDERREGRDGPPGGPPGDRPPPDR